MKIKAIETLYAGRYYRSRLEARWAVFFDAMKIKANYEIVGFDLGGERYLPDFHIPDWGMHVEIKPPHMTRWDEERISRILEAFEECGEGLAIICGEPSLGGYVMMLGQNYEAMYWWLAPCRRCSGVSVIDITSSAWGNLGTHTCVDHDRPPVGNDDRILAAYTRAMRYRFDHLRPETIHQDTP